MATDFQWNASEYAKSSSVQQIWARELIGKLKLKGNEKILDIGCGDGKVTLELAAQVPNGSVLGIDSSKEMIALAQNKFPVESHANLRFQYGDASALSFQQEFDVVFSNATLHWIVDHHPVLKGIYSSLKHGGKILLQMGGQGNAADVASSLKTLILKDEWKKYFHGFTFLYGFYGTKEYLPWLKEAQFEPVRVELIPKDAAHKNREAFESWIRTTWIPWTQRVPVEQRDLFIQQLATIYMEQHPSDAQGVVHVTMARLEVEARKG